MTLIIASALILELSFFIFYDLTKGSGKKTRRQFIRMVSGLSGILMVSADMLLIRPPSTGGLVADMTVAAGIAAMSPCSFEKPAVFLRFAVAGACAGLFPLLVFFLLPAGYPAFRTQRMVFTMAALIPVFACYQSFVAFRRFKGIRLMFRNAAVWYNIEDYSRFLYSTAFLCVCTLAVCAAAVPGDPGLFLEVFCILLLMALYALLYLRALTGRTFVLGEQAEIKIKDIIKGNLRTSFADKVEEDRKMNNLYRKIMLYMNEGKPYLDPSFCMDDMAGKVYSNKLYLSRTINILSGRNFRQFVNYHRVQYAMALFRKDPKLKVSEAAEMSGFNSGVSFNMAFKVNTGMTPSEWLQEHACDPKDQW